METAIDAGRIGAQGGLDVQGHVDEEREEKAEEEGVERRAASAGDDANDMIAVALGAEVAREDATLAEAHFARQLVDLRRDQAQQAGMAAFASELRLVLTERDQLRPPLIQIRGPSHDARA
jgi:hypothetical protein